MQEPLNPGNHNEILQTLESTKNNYSY